MYKKFAIEDLKFLQEVCGAERVTARDDIGEDFCHDELGGTHARPDAHVKVALVTTPSVPSEPTIRSLSA